MNDIVRSLTGTEEIVMFVPGESFTGVTPEWLLPRLRLDPASSSVNLMDGLVIFIDDEPFDLPDGDVIQDISDVLDPEAPDGEIVSYDNGGIIGGRFDLVRGWIRDWSPEVREDLVFVGEDPDLHTLAREKLVEGTFYWEAQEHELFNVDSPYLSAEDPADVEFVLGAACEAGRVVLNGVALRG